MDHYNVPDKYRIALLKPRKGGKAYDRGSYCGMTFTELRNKFSHEYVTGTYASIMPYVIEYNLSDYGEVFWIQLIKLITTTVPNCYVYSYIFTCYLKFKNWYRKSKVQLINCQHYRNMLAQCMSMAMSFNKAPWYLDVKNMRLPAGYEASPDKLVKIHETQNPDLMKDLTEIDYHYSVSNYDNVYKCIEQIYDTPILVNAKGKRPINNIMYIYSIYISASKSKCIIRKSSKGKSVFNTLKKMLQKLIHWRERGSAITVLYVLMKNNREVTDHDLIRELLLSKRTVIDVLKCNLHYKSHLHSMQTIMDQR